MLVLLLIPVCVWRRNGEVRRSLRWFVVLNVDVSILVVRYVLWYSYYYVESTCFIFCFYALMRGVCSVFYCRFLYSCGGEILLTVLIWLILHLYCLACLFALLSLGCLSVMYLHFVMRNFVVLIWLILHFYCLACLFALSLGCLSVMYLHFTMYVAEKFCLLC